MVAARKSPKRRATRLRDSERTRERLLQAASREIYRSGFQSASLDTILAVAGVTKGALYYHFDSKEALGHAVFDEVIAPDVRGKWMRPLQSGKDPSVEARSNPKLSSSADGLIRASPPTRDARHSIYEGSIAPSGRYVDGLFGRSVGRRKKILITDGRGYVLRQQHPQPACGVRRLVRKPRQPPCRTCDRLCPRRCQHED
jgi:AcrR family transcriptional regulator